MQAIIAANRFDALRLAFASAVAFFHLALLGGLAPPAGALMRFLEFAAEIGVEGFFIISGALVYRSLLRSSSLRLYAEKRARRIVPAYAAIIAAPMLAALAASIGSANIGEDLRQIARYFLANITLLNFLAPTLPHLFADNPIAEVNGALWTIKVEVAFYAVLPAIAFVLGRAGRWRWAVLALLYAGGEAWRAGFEWRAASGGGELFERLSYQLPGQMAFFAAGVALAMAWDQATTRPLRFALAGALLFILSLWPPLEALRAAGLMGLIAAAAFAPGPEIAAARWGDVSYGVYICHFPIIQAVVASGAFDASPFPAILLTLLMIGGASLAMWRFIESPFLLKDSHYHLMGRGAPGSARRPDPFQSPLFPLCSRHAPAQETDIAADHAESRDHAWRVQRGCRDLS